MCNLQIGSENDFINIDADPEIFKEIIEMLRHNKGVYDLPAIDGTQQQID